MEATRPRFGARLGAALEWVLAAALILALLAAGSILIREARTVRPVMPVIASEAPADEPSAALPERAVSVPMLLLGPEVTLRIADREAEVRRMLGGAGRVAGETIQHINGVERVLRTYDYLGTRFVLVFQAAHPGGERALAAIYRQ